MATNAKKPRKRINRIVWILAKIYEFDYKTTQRIYNQFDKDIKMSQIDQAKIKLNLEKQKLSMATA